MEDASRRSDPLPSGAVPAIGLSICIPSYERSEQLRQLLDSIDAAALEAGAELGSVEIVVALDGSTDGSEATLRSWCGVSDARLVWRNLHHRGLAAHRKRRATAMASGELVLLCDDDNLVTAACLVAHSRHDRGTGAVLMGPSVMTTSNDGMLTKNWYDERHQRLARSRQVLDPADFSAAATSAPRDVWLRFPFDETFVGYGFEDYDVATRLLDAGVGISFSADAAVVHVHWPTDRERLTHKEAEGRNAVRFARLHPQRLWAAFAPRCGRFEEILRAVCYRRMARPLMLGASAFRVARVVAPSNRRSRLWVRAQLLARYAGVAAEGGRDVATSAVGRSAQSPLIPAAVGSTRRAVRRHVGTSAALVSPAVTSACRDDLVDGAGPRVVGEAPAVDPLVLSDRRLQKPSDAHGCWGRKAEDLTPAARALVLSARADPRHGAQGVRAQPAGSTFT